jgi:hypothetical protein
MIAYYKELTNSLVDTNTRGSKVVSQLVYNLVFFLIVILNAIVPEMISCRSTGLPFRQRISSSIMAYVFSLSFVYSIRNMLVIVRTCTEILSLSAAAPNGTGEVSTHIREAMEDASKWKSLRSRYRIYCVIALLALVYNVFNGTQHVINSSKPFHADPATLNSAGSYIPDFLFLLLLVAGGYYNAVDGSVLLVSAIEGSGSHHGLTNSSTLSRRWSRWILLLSCMIGFMALPVGYVVACIYNEDGVAVTIGIMVFGTLQFCLTLLTFGLDWSRNEEIDACSTYLQGKTPRLLNSMLLSWEVIGFLSLSLDPFFLWWSPEWMKIGGMVLFNTVSLDSISSWSRTLMGDVVSFRFVSNFMYASLSVFFVCQTVSTFARLPLRVIRLINIVNFVLFDVATMPVVSFLIKRLHCEDVDGASRSTSVFYSGTLVGYETVLCDRSYEHILSLFIGASVLGYTCVVGTFYNGVIRNKVSKPRVMDIPAFATFKYLMKLTLAFVISLTPNEAASTPWIRASSNLLCLLMLTAVSLSTWPVMGPESKKWNQRRSVGYAIALGFSASTMLNLVVHTSVGESSSSSWLYVVTFMSLPVLLGVVTFQLFSRRHTAQSEDVRQLCVTIRRTAVSYEESVALSLQVTNIKFSAALLVSSSESFVVQLNLKLVSLSQLLISPALDLPSIDIMTISNAEESVRALKSVANACLYSIGLRKVKDVCLNPLVEILTSSLHALYRLNDEMPSRQTATSPSTDFSDRSTHAYYDRAMVAKNVMALRSILCLCFGALTDIISFSKHYKKTFVTKHPHMFETVVRLGNTMGCYDFFEEEYGDEESMMRFTQSWLFLLRALKDDDSGAENTTVGTASHSIASAHDSPTVVSLPSSPTARSSVKKARKLLYALHIVSVSKAVRGQLLKELILSNSSTSSNRKFFEIHDSKGAGQSPAAAASISPPSLSRQQRPSRPTHHPRSTRVAPTPSSPVHRPSHLHSEDRSLRVAPTPSSPVHRPSHLHSEDSDQIYGEDVFSSRGVTSASSSFIVEQRFTSSLRANTAGIVDGRILWIDNTLNEVVAQNIMKEITEYLKSILTTEKLKTSKLFVCVGVVGIDEATLCTVVQAWKAIKYSGVELFVVSLSQRPQSAPKYYDHSLELYRLLDAALLREIKADKERKKMWTANGVIAGV